MKSTLRNMLISLGGTAVISAVLLSGVDALTREPIAAAEARALDGALEEVMPPYDSAISTTELGDGETLYSANMGNEPSGYAVTSYTDNGFGGRITVLFGFDAEGKVTGYRILSHSETPGLGAKAVDWFCEGGTSHDITGSSSRVMLKNDGGSIDAITGATITSRAFIEALDKARTILQEKI